MKSLVTVSILATTLQFAAAVFGQDEEQPGGRHRWEQRLANLSPEERQKLQAARKKAMQDPAVQAAHDKMRQSGSRISRRHASGDAQSRSISSADSK